MINAVLIGSPDKMNGFFICLVNCYWCYILIMFEAHFRKTSHSDWLSPAILPAVTCSCVPIAIWYTRKAKLLLKEKRENS